MAGKAVDVVSVSPPAASVDDDADEIERIRALTVAERLELGVALSRTAAEFRRAAWEAQRGRSAAA